MLGGAAAAWPLAARARQPSELPTIGFLGVATPSTWGQWVAAFVQRLRDLGWIEGRTVAIEFRWTDGRSDRFAEIAAEFARLKVDVIVTAGPPSPLRGRRPGHPDRLRDSGGPARQPACRQSARPGGNVTGLSLQHPDTASKRLELLREVIPGLRRLAIMANAGLSNSVLEMDEVQTTAHPLGFEIVA